MDKLEFSPQWIREILKLTLKFLILFIVYHAIDCIIHYFPDSILFKGILALIIVNLFFEEKKDNYEE